MAVTYDSSYKGSGTSSAVITTGAVADGKVMYAVVVPNSGTPTAPAGWTQLDASVNDGGKNVGLFRKVASGEGTTQTFSASGATYTEAVLYIVAGNDTTTPEDCAISVNKGTAGTPSWNTITTVTANTLNLLLATETGSGVVLSGFPAGYTLGIAGDFVANGAYKSVAGVGAISGLTGTSAGGYWLVYSIAIRPAGAGGSTYNVSASDAATATDTATQQLTAPAAATDAASAADSASNLGVLTRSASDAAAATDAATVTLTIPASASDAATATDASTSASAVNSAATDAVAASDAATQLAVLPAVASDAAAVTDAATNLGVLTRSATDAAAASDAATGLRVTLGSATDAVTATDTAAQVSAANVAATDAISAADAATVQAVLVGIVSDGFSAIDAATLLAGIYNITATDVLSLLDVALADGGVQYARAPSGMGSPLIYPGTERPAVISGTRPGNINTARPANRGGRRS